MKTVSILALAVPAAAFTSQNSAARQSTTQISETKADLEVLAAELNPAIRFYDPLNLASSGLYGLDEEESIRYLREAEIKHGRVAMAAFVGHCVQMNYVFPWRLTTDGDMMPGTDLSPPAQWDALPFAAKAQIIGFVGFLEWFTYTNKTDKIGEFPSFKDKLPHPVPYDLFDPFKLHKNRKPEKNQKSLLAEINNGRLAMIGIFSFVTAETIPGSVPLLTNIVKPYAGDYWAPFES
mmetsp:Transcript_12046/g.28558  ORF Transcript_12046/g.28558 Transcript_12046/m.28558 type:complete len:236 (+) Transcript_12046:123-830(+)|eukprot:CAMPEP_0197172966 /NCGR_PEP_ID=MMETSP1423-20130617/48_1 /TAXON_ID=476441 /ORGANISM="Pseudo-nitzschia heimii, Strain UNC1101" /LENGTH=235 /DNA_ID=CAMNT_0042621697 /DNA_START=59 /DNA_END=766 /DNA_ORIENTATION=+